MDRGTEMELGICPTCLTAFPCRKRNTRKAGKAIYCSRPCWDNRKTKRSKDKPGEYFSKKENRWRVYWSENGKKICKRKAIWVWEKHNGPKPDGFDIHHKDEKRENDSIENLELIKEEEHDDLHNFQKFSQAVDDIIEGEEGLQERGYE